MENYKTIGVVGGVGPYAGIDLTEKIFNETLARSDQDHLPVALLSFPHRITDRTEYLLGKVQDNPAYAVARIILQLEQAGASAIGIPCNTMHVPEIFDVIQGEINKSGTNIILLNMLDEVIGFIKHLYPGIEKVGVLSTTGTYQSGVYINKLEKSGLGGITTPPDVQDKIHQAIYNSDYGIKSVSNPVTKKATNILVNGIRYLKKKGAQGIILGCTEIGYALPYKKLNEIPLFDASTILARALISNTNPDKLRPFEPV